MTTVLSLIALTPNKLGSYEEFEVLLARRMRLLGWRSVKIFNDSPKGDLLNAILDTGCELNTLPQHFSKISSMLHAAALFRNFKPDLLHVSFHPMTTPLSILARTCGVKKIIFTDHFSGMPPLNSAPKELFRSIRNKFSMFPINKFIAVSRFVAHRLETRSGVSPHKIRVIYNGINTQRFHNKTDRALIRESLGVPFGDFLFIAVAHLIKSKGIHHFLDAGKILLAKGLNVSFVIVGTGPELDKLQDQASALNMTPKVHFVGLRNDVNLLMGSADALVCPYFGMRHLGLLMQKLCSVEYLSLHPEWAGFLNLSQIERPAF